MDGTVRQFDIRMGMMLTDNLHEPVTGIAVSHDGNCILASCLDNSMRLLDKVSGELLASYTGRCYPKVFIHQPASCCIQCLCAHIMLLGTCGIALC